MKIDDAEQSLRAVYQDWSSYLLNPRFMRKKSLINWVGYSPKILGYPVMVSDVTGLSEDGQYSFQWPDGSLFQIFYRYDMRGNNLLAANLAFYSSKTLVDVVLENQGVTDNTIQTEDLAFEESSTEQVLEEQLPIEAIDYSDIQEAVSQPEREVYIASQEGIASWVRVDYAPNQARGVLHYDCHMHLSMFNNSRLVVDGIPNPRQFVEFIIALCYPDVYSDHRLNAGGEYHDHELMHAVNTPCLPGIANVVCKHITHLHVPNTLGAQRTAH